MSTRGPSISEYTAALRRDAAALKVTPEALLARPASYTAPSIGATALGAATRLSGELRARRVVLVWVTCLTCLFLAVGAAMAIAPKPPSALGDEILAVGKKLLDVGTAIASTGKQPPDLGAKVLAAGEKLQSVGDAMANAAKQPPAIGDKLMASGKQTVVLVCLAVVGAVASLFFWESFATVDHHITSLDLAVRWRDPALAALALYRASCPRMVPLYNAVVDDAAGGGPGVQRLRDIVAVLDFPALSIANARDAVLKGFFVLGTVVGMAVLLWQARSYMKPTVLIFAAVLGALAAVALAVPVFTDLIRADALKDVQNERLLEVLDKDVDGFVDDMNRNKSPTFRNPNNLRAGVVHVVTLLITAFAVTLVATLGSWNLGPRLSIAHKQMLSLAILVTGLVVVYCGWALLQHEYARSAEGSK